MKILHTSDWHLGRSFHREGLLNAQSSFVDHLVETVRAERIDLVVVSGDVYDRALPPVDAVALAHEALRRLAGLRIPVVITAGNHDSARRLGFAADLIAAAGVHLRTDPFRLHEPVMVPDADGEVAVYGLPYLEPELLREPWGLRHRSHRAVMDEAMARVRSDLAARPGVRSVVLAHTWVTGGEPSDSERDIGLSDVHRGDVDQSEMSRGGIGLVRASVFDGIDYVALGHLHGRQQITDRVRYSGSPLAYSFSEVHHTKGSWLLELAADGAVAADFVAAPVPRRLGVLSGELEDLLHDPAHHHLEDRWLQVTLTDPQRPRAAMEQLRRRFPHALVLRFAPAGTATGASSAPEVSGRSDAQVLTEFVTAVRQVDADPAERALLAAACDACASTEASA